MTGAQHFHYPERCPKCFAPAGQPCRTRGRVVRGPHVGRTVTLAESHPYRREAS